MDIDMLNTMLNHDRPDVLPHLPSSTLTVSCTEGPPTSHRGPFEIPSKTSTQAGTVITRIEDIFESMVDCMLGEKKELIIQLKTRTRRGQHTSETQGAIRDDQRLQIRDIRFPGRTAFEAWKFAALLRILELCHEALITGATITKRDMYYRDPELFTKQTVVDQYVNDLALTLGVERGALNVVAAAKGLVAGSLTLRRHDGGMVDCSAGNGGVLIPHVKEISSYLVGRVRWILVVEKEATFQTLCSNQYWKSSKSGHGILVTAKGYPDIQTRAFLQAISLANPFLLVYGLFDFDPDGIGIMSTYKHGSSALSHENATLVVRNMRWLGLRSTDIIRNTNFRDHQGLLRLTPRDRRMAGRMLEKQMCQEDVEPEWRRELQVMLMLNIKAEIQIINNDRNLEDYLDTQLSYR